MHRFHSFDSGLAILLPRKITILEAGNPVRREGELAIRAALGANARILRRTLLAKSVLLCGAGALLGVLAAQPMVAILARYASRFSVRALGLTVDSSMLWVGAGLAIIAAVLLAFVPRLPPPLHRMGSVWRTAALVSRAARTGGCGFSQSYKSPPLSSSW